MYKNKKILLFLAVVLTGAVAGCDDNSYSTSDLSKISIMAAAVNQSYDPALTASVAKEIQAGVKSIFNTALTRGGLNAPAYEPNSTNPASSSLALPANYTFNYEDYWHGPDLWGWWTKQLIQAGGYNQTLKIRRMALLNAFEYQLTITYNAEGVAFSYQDHLYWAVDNQGQINGYFNMKESTSVHSTVHEEVEWNFNFTNWSPATGAGTFSWSWGASASGDYDFDYHQYLTLVATAGDLPILHTDVTWFDNYGTYQGSYDYETPFVSVNISPSLFNN